MIAIHRTQFSSHRLIQSSSLAIDSFTRSPSLTIRTQLYNSFNATMQLITVFSVALLALGVTAQNGERICVGGAISCEYQKGRCAVICNGSHESGAGSPAFVDPLCSCPNGQADNLYTGAACIDVIRALGRQNC